MRLCDQGLDELFGSYKWYGFDNYDIVDLNWNSGKKHIQNLGMSMKLKRSTVEDVKARFELNKQKRQEKVEEYSLKERLQDAKEEQERMVAYSAQVYFHVVLVNLF